MNSDRQNNTLQLDDLNLFIQFGNDVTRTEGVLAYSTIIDKIDETLPPETDEQTARCIGKQSLMLDLDKML